MPKLIVSFDEQAMKDELRELVRKTIEETINAMLDEEADQLVGAGPYERTDERAAYRAGHYERGFTTTSGQVTLKMPKLKGMRFATAVIERCKRRETSVEEVIIEMYLAGVSTRRIEDISEILWGAGVSAGIVGSIAEVFPKVKYQRCTVHFCRNVLAKVPKSKRSQAAAMLKAIHAMESRGASAAKAESVAAELEPMKLKEAAKVVREGFAETLTYCEMPREHWRRIRTNNAIERLNRETRQDPRRGHVPRRKVRPDAGNGPSEVRPRRRMGVPPLPGRVSAQGVAVPAAGESAQNY